MVNVATDHAVDSPLPGLLGEHVLEIRDELYRVLDPVLQEPRQRPVRKPADPPDVVEDPVALQHHAVRPVAQAIEPPRIPYDAVEPVPMHHEEPPVVGRHVDRLGADLDPGHLEAIELPRGFVMVARDKDNVDADVGSPQELANHGLMAGRPVPGLLQPPAIDDVADEIEGGALHGAQEREQVIRPAPPGAEVDVGDPQCADPPGDTDDVHVRNAPRQQRRRSNDPPPSSN